MKGVKIPITIVTGCLGSGKTTLLSGILKDPGMVNVAVLVNEFGKVGLDHHLLRQVDEETVLLDGGCVCCNRREDLENTLIELFDKFEKGLVSKLDRVVIETTGLADPAPIIFTILTNPILQNHFYVDCVVTVVDAVNGELHLRNQPEALKQITVADKIVITKTDLANQENIDDLINQIELINPSSLITKNSVDQQNVELLVGTMINDGRIVNMAKMTDKAHLKENIDNIETDIQSISFTFDKPLDWTAFGVWLSMLLHARGEEVLRVKGLLDVGEIGPVVLNGVQHIIHPPDHLDQWPDNEKYSHLVFIVRSIKPESITASLQTFQNFLGSKPEVIELNAQM